MFFRSWFQRWRRNREIRKLLDEAFRNPETLRGTSLKPRHAARYIVLGHEEENDQVRFIHFGIVRHPRPYAFSAQHHKVVELYTYDVLARRLNVIQGINLTREEGRDADD